jgi:hypothetical protein
MENPPRWLFRIKKKLGRVSRAVDCAAANTSNYLMYCYSVGTENVMHTESNQVNEKRGCDGRKRGLAKGEVERHAMCRSLNVTIAGTMK